MNIEEWAKAQNLSWEKVARELSLITMRLTRNESNGAPGTALYSARLWNLRTGRIKPRPYELQALQELTGGDVESFRVGAG